MVLLLFDDFDFGAQYHLWLCHSEMIFCTYELTDGSDFQGPFYPASISFSTSSQECICRRGGGGVLERSLIGKDAMVTQEWTLWDVAMLLDIFAASLNTFIHFCLAFFSRAISTLSVTSTITQGSLQTMTFSALFCLPLLLVCPMIWRKCSPLHHLRNPSYKPLPRQRLYQGTMEIQPV